MKIGRKDNLPNAALLNFLPIAAKAVQSFKQAISFFNVACRQQFGKIRRLALSANLQRPLPKFLVFLLLHNDLLLHSVYQSFVS